LSASKAQPAIRTRDAELAYEELHHGAVNICERLDSSYADDAVIGIVCDRELSGFVGVIACLLGGRTYVPLNLKFPAQRLASIIERAGIATILVGDDLQTAWDATGIDFPQVEQLSMGHITRESTGELPASKDNATSYVLFTSGSTGIPKGVPILETNLSAFYREAAARVAPTANDVFSQTFELSFDLSMQDILLAIGAGACLVIADDADLGCPADYAKRHAITVWFAVPSLMYVFDAQGKMTSEYLATLRYSMFCGEKLPTRLALNWLAATGQIVENWFGPTECTIACSNYRMTGNETDAVVPIGEPFGGTQFRIETIEEGVDELWLAGQQLFPGYLHDAEKTAEAITDADGTRWYRTGDRVKRTEDGEILILDRLGGMVKVNGYRVELSEIENTAEDILKSATSVAYLSSRGERDKIGLAIETTDAEDIQQVKDRIGDILPTYMVPKEFTPLEQFPRNRSGKIDRNKVGELARNYQAGVSRHNHESFPTLAALLDEIEVAVDRLADDQSLERSGLDSLDLVNLTVAFEKQTGRTLAEHQVSEITNLSIAELEGFLSGESIPAALDPDAREARYIDYKKVLLNPRAGRFHSIVKHLRKHSIADYKMVMLGTSGLYRATRAIPGLPDRALNIATPGMSLQAQYELAQYLADKGNKVEQALVEIDPVMLTDKRPAGDLYVHDEFFTKKLMAPAVPSEFNFDIKVSGFAEKAKKQSAVAVDEKSWRSERDEVVQACYRGEVAFEQQQIEFTQQAIVELQKIADSVVIFLHPLSFWYEPAADAAAEEAGAVQVIRAAMAGASLQFLTYSDVALSANDFIDINHLNADGADKLSQAVLATL